MKHEAKSFFEAALFRIHVSCGVSVSPGRSHYFFLVSLSEPVCKLSLTLPLVLSLFVSLCASHCLSHCL